MKIDSHFIYLCSTIFLLHLLTVFQKYETKLKQLNLPLFSFKIIGEENKKEIFDPIRKKYMRLTPEEWVRQNFVQYLIHHGKYPAGLIGIEVMFRLNNLSRRVDILVHNRAGIPVMIIECKSPDININDKVFDQIVCYNMKFKLPYLIVTNGMDHYACKIDIANKKYEFLNVIPLYEDILV
jgi:hypothetical protein